MRTVHKLALAFQAARNYRPWMSFRSGEGGGDYLPFLAYQDTGTATPAVAVADPTGHLASQSAPAGTRLEFTQATVASKPTLGTMVEGGKTNQIPHNAWTDATNGAIAAAGAELITNGLFLSDFSGWTNASSGTGSATWASGGVNLVGGTSGIGAVRQSVSVTAGVVYTVSATAEGQAMSSMRLGTTIGGTEIADVTITANQCRVITFTAAATGTVYLEFRKTTNATSSLFVVSFRQQRLPTTMQGDLTGNIGRRARLTVTAVGMVAGVNTFSLRYEIPVTGGASTSIFINFNSTTSVPALTGQTWSASGYLALSAGSLTNISAVRFRLQEKTSAGANVAGGAHSGSSLSSSLTSTLTSFTYLGVLLSGDATTANLQSQINLAITAGTIVDATFMIGEYQIERAAVPSAMQTINSATPYNAPALGAQNVLLPYGDGGDVLGTGVVGWGANTQGAYAAAGKNWTIQGTGSTFVAGVICAQTEQAADANQMFNLRTIEAGLELVVRGTVNTYTATPLTGVTLNFAIVCTNGVVTININGTGRQAVTVGSAAAEAVFFTWFARNNTTPAGFLTGFSQPVVFLDRAMSGTEETQALSFMRSTFGGP